jgi:DNA-binding NarL/FixJ family response regulator
MRVDPAMGRGVRQEARKARPVCTVVLIDQEPLFLDALRQRISTIRGVKVISRLVSDGASAITATRADVIVCDPSSGSRFEKNYLVELRRVLPRPKIIVLTNHDEPQVIAFSLAHGVDSFILKSEPIETIRCAIELVCRGGVAFSVPVAALLPSSLTLSVVEPSLPAPVARGLSPREIEVLDLVGRGCTDAETGRLLGISVRTTQRHVTNVLNKLNCRNRSEAVAKVVGSAPLALVTLIAGSYLPGF